jgi:cytochrome c oxidase subunit 2
MVSPRTETTGFCAATCGNPKAAQSSPREREKNMRLLTKVRGLAALALTGLMSGTALADALQPLGHPQPQLMGLQPAATSLAVQSHNLDHMLLVIVSVITAFVVALLAYVIVRFNARANPTPKTFTHNTPLEIAWTLVPIVILVFIGSFSLPALFNQLEIPTPDMTIKVTGNQWYWSYEYPDAGVSFDSNMIGNATTAEDGVTPYVLDAKMEAQLAKSGYTRDDFLLAVDNPLVVPVGKVVKVIITGSDVIHAWAVPAFGVMHSAVPGRLGEMWFKVDAPGIYYGQCTTLCGQAHAYMPIEVKAVPEDVYAKWLEQAKTGNVQLAQN